MTSESKDMTAEVAKGALLLAAGLETSEVAKAAELEKAANPFIDAKEDDDKKDDKKDKKEETEKAMNAEEMEKAVEAACEKAVEKALAPLMLILTGVQKSLELADSKASSTLAFQNASTAVLMSLKDVTTEGVQVSKASAVVIDAVAAQPAGRKTVELEAVEKSQAVERLDVSLEKLREVCKGMDLGDFITVKKDVMAGNYSGLSHKQRVALSIPGDK